MKKLIYGALAPVAGFLIAIAMPFAAKAQTNNMTVTPWTFVGMAGDCGTGTPAGSQTYGEGQNVVSRWVSDMGNPGPSLYLQKFAPTTDCSSAGADINGVSGIALTELNFDYYSADTNAHCGAGAPRFNVTTSDNVVHFFGCSSGTTSDAGNGWTHVVFDPTNASQAFPVIGSGLTVSSISIVFDEQGYTHIDNISVNNQTVGRGNTPWTKQACFKGGYTNFTDNNGNPFKNQGQCVAFVERGQHYNHKNANSVNVQNVTNLSQTNTQ